jgi:4-carboxymuconolactone decarboxylase
MTRIPEITAREQLPEDLRHCFDEIVASRGSVRGPFRVLLHSPDFAARVAHVGTYVRFESKLDPHVRELATLIAARLLDCEYEYSAHQPQLRATGTPEAVLTAVDQKRPSDLPDEDRWIYELVEQLIERHRISPETFDTARKRLGDANLVELVGTVGYYALLAAALNAFEVEPLQS